MTEDASFLCSVFQRHTDVIVVLYPRQGILGFGVVEKAVVIAFDQNDLPVKRAYQFRCIIVPAFPDKVAKDVYLGKLNERLIRSLMLCGWR